MYSQIFHQGWRSQWSWYPWWTHRSSWWLLWVRATTSTKQEMNIDFLGSTHARSTIYSLIYLHHFHTSNDFSFSRELRNCNVLGNDLLLSINRQSVAVFLWCAQNLALRVDMPLVRTHCLHVCGATVAGYRLASIMPRSYRLPSEFWIFLTTSLPITTAALGGNHGSLSCHICERIDWKAQKFFTILKMG